MRRLFRVLVLVAAACSTKAPNSSPPTRAPHDVAMAPQGAAAATAQQGQAAGDPREAELAQTVLQLLQEQHLLHKKIDDEISREAFKTYLDRLDPLKAYLLRSDREALGRYADQIDDELRSGVLELAHEGEKIYVARVEMVDKYVQTLLAAPMNHTDEEFIEIDPKKLEAPTTEDELRDRWRKRLELEVLERVGQMEARLEAKAKPKDGKNKDKDGSGSTSDEDRAMPVAEIPATPEAREAKARADLAKTYASRFARLSHPEPLDAASDLLNAVTSTLDPHTSYLPPADKANFDIQMSGSLEGIGASLRERDHYIEVIELVPGGAAWRQGGLSQGDQILAVQNEGKDPVDVVDMHIDDVVRMIRGPKNTVVRLRVQKTDGHEETIAITRDVIVIEEAYARAAVLERKTGPRIGYIHLPAFYGGSKGGRMASADIKRLLHALEDKKVAGVILDIRSNGGGLLQDAVKLTGEFIDKGPVVQVRDHEGHREVLGDDDKGTDYDGPLIVLVDRFSASASEILAGALQDYKRAVIVGTGPTHGKGTVQTLADLDRFAGRRDDLGVLKLTIEQFFRVSGASTQMQGVVPDIVLPDPEGFVDAGERQLEHAIPWSQIDRAPHDDWKAKWSSTVLVKNSAARVAKSPLLSKIAAATEIMRARKNDTRMPLEQKAWQQRRKDLKAAIDAASPDLVHAPAAFTVQTIEDPANGHSAPGPGGKTDDRPAKWRDSLARDPWVEECAAILGDIVK